MATVWPEAAKHIDASSAPARWQVRFGEVWVDAITREQAFDILRHLVTHGGGAVYTPNVDHVVLAERDARLRVAYSRASLCLADGAPIVWSAPLLGCAIPEKLSGSDLALPIARLAGEMGWRLYLLGGAPGVAAAAATRFREECGALVVGVDDAMVHLDGDLASERAIVDRITAARPHLVFVALGAPKQELWIDRHLDEIRPAVAIGVGASLDFVAGHVQRAPAWMSRIGAEWVFRLLQEPRRLWRRYLIQDPQFVGILLRSMRRPRHARVRQR